MEENKIDNLKILIQSDGWKTLCKAIDDNISRLDTLINDDSPGCEENDKMIYTGRVLNIKQKKILQNLKKLPEKLIEDYAGQIPTEETLEEMIKSY